MPSKTRVTTMPGGERVILHRVGAEWRGISEAQHRVLAVHREPSKISKLYGDQWTARTWPGVSIWDDEAGELHRGEERPTIDSAVASLAINHMPNRSE